MHQLRRSRHPTYESGTHGGASPTPLKRGKDTERDEESERLKTHSKAREGLEFKPDQQLEGKRYRATDDELPRVHCDAVKDLSLIHISEPTRQAEISYAVFC